MGVELVSSVPCSAQDGRLNPPSSSPSQLQGMKNRYRSFDDSQLWAMTKLSGVVKQKVIVYDCKKEYSPKHFTGWSMNKWTFMDGMETCNNDVSSKEMVHVHLIPSLTW